MGKTLSIWWYFYLSFFLWFHVRAVGCHCYYRQVIYLNWPFSIRIDSCDWWPMRTTTWVQCVFICFHRAAIIYLYALIIIIKIQYELALLWHTTNTHRYGSHGPVMEKIINICNLICGPIGAAVNCGRSNENDIGNILWLWHSLLPCGNCCSWRRLYVYYTVQQDDWYGMHQSQACAYNNMEAAENRENITAQKVNAVLE